MLHSTCPDEELEEKSFLKEFSVTNFQLSAKNLRPPEKCFGQFCQNCFLRVQGNISVKNLWKLFLLPSFGDFEWSVWLFFENFVCGVVKTEYFMSMGQPWDFSSEHIGYSVNFGQWADTFRLFVENFWRVCQKQFIRVQLNSFGKK